MIPGNASQHDDAKLGKVQESCTSVPAGCFRQLTPGKRAFCKEEQDCGNENDGDGNHFKILQWQISNGPEIMQAEWYGSTEEVTVSSAVTLGLAVHAREILLRRFR